MKTKIKYHGDEVTNLNDKEIPKVETRNYFGFCTQERWHLLSASVFKVVQIYW